MRKGYKQTVVGAIPDDWEVSKLGCFADVTKLAGFEYSKYFNSYKDEGEIIVIRGTNITYNKLDVSDIRTIPRKISNLLQRSKLNKGDLVFAYVGTIGPVYLIDENDKYHLGPNTSKITINRSVSKDFIYSYFKSWLIKNEIIELTSIGAQPSLSMTKIRNFRVLLPPTKAEQTAIATALSDADALIQSLEKLIAKKRLIKQGSIQELLKPKEGWEVKKLGESTNCLDNLRIPLNESQRATMKGDIPYCGANGILDYINDYCIDDDIILIAEDGGYFDEYEHRPIAYKISGKCWVNNHAHILKAKEDMSQNFIFYSLVHKNILRFLASGTRAKLNKSELYKIEIDVPPTIEDQTYIATILSEMDTEISTLENKLTKYKQIKQGMMQELLTGKTRLI